LANPAAEYRFHARRDGFNRLLKQLRQDEAHEPLAIASPEEILLSREGKTRSGYRFTTQALRQLCALLAKGLADYVADIGGFRAARVPRPAHLPCAIRAVNDAIRARFDDLVGHGLILNIRAKQIEGVVGSHYQFFANAELAEVVDEFATKEAYTGLKFWHAALAGRHLLLYYVSRPVAKVPWPDGHKDVYHLGLRVSNSEIGDCEIRSAVCLVRQRSMLFAARPVANLVHRKGKGFQKRLRAVLDKTDKGLQSLHTPTMIGQRIVRLRKQRLMGDVETDPPASILRKLEKQLIRPKKLRQPVAKRVVRRALVLGSHPKARLDCDPSGDSLPAMDLGRLLRLRTVCDLFHAVAQEAQAMSIDHREAAEDLAYRIFSGNISF
jgi:hypothetical protein